MEKLQLRRFDFLDNLEVLYAENYRSDFPAHFHEEWCITLTLKGLECTRSKYQDLLSPCGHISITPPGNIHANPNQDSGNFSFVTFYISPDVSKYLDFRLDRSFSNQVAYDPALFQDLLSWGLNEPQESADLLPLLKKLLSAMLPIEEAEKEVDFEILQELSYFLEHHFAERIHLSELAEKFSLSKYQLLRKFKKFRGVPPGTYLTLLRIKEAKKRLQAGQAIVEVALACGFYDQSHFHKYFRKYVGLTPETYLKACNILQDSKDD